MEMGVGKKKKKKKKHGRELSGHQGSGGHLFQIAIVYPFPGLVLTEKDLSEESYDGVVLQNKTPTASEAHMHQDYPVTGRQKRGAPRWICEVCIPQRSHWIKFFYLYHSEPCPKKL